jgi:hypothetical protein
MLAAVSPLFGQKSAPAGHSPVKQDPAQIGQWSSPINTDGVTAIFAAMLPSGKILFFQYTTRTPPSNSLATVWDPLSNTFTTDTFTYTYDIFCSGQTSLKDGRVFIAGGDADIGLTVSAGIVNTTFFDPNTFAWSTGPNMFLARWYPSVVHLGNDNVLIMSGRDQTGINVNTQMELYNPVTNTMKLLPTSANQPDQDLYPRMVLMTNGNLFKAGPSQATYTFSPATNKWTFVANMNYGPIRFGGGAVLLPGLKKVLVAGGSPVSVGGGSGSTNTAEIIDLSAATPAWSYTGSMTYSRFNANLVLLADGTVLDVGGGSVGKYGNSVFQPELYDPNTGLWTVMAPATKERTYHSTAMLLPDGRVYSAGTDDPADTADSKTTEIFSPPYLFKGRRPAITSPPTSLTYNQTFTFNATDTTDITRVAMIKTGSTTHANNFDQRYVDLTFSTGTGQIKATAPANSNIAPPGYYMLVIVNSSGVPSIMPIVQLQ